MVKNSYLFPCIKKLLSTFIKFPIKKLYDYQMLYSPIPKGDKCG